MTPEQEQDESFKLWHEISKRKRSLAASERQRRDNQSFGLQTGNPIMVPIPLDPDLAELYGTVAGTRYQLTPTDILLVQVIRLHTSVREPTVSEPIVKTSIIQPTA